MLHEAGQLSVNRVTEYKVYVGGMRERAPPEDGDQKSPYWPPIAAMWLRTELNVGQDAATKAIANRIQEVRGGVSISQGELAFRCRLHRTYIGGVQRGERNINLVNFCQIGAGTEEELRTVGRS